MAKTLHVKFRLQGIDTVQNSTTYNDVESWDVDEMNMDMIVVRFTPKGKFVVALLPIDAVERIEVTEVPDEPAP